MSKPEKASKSRKKTFYETSFSALQVKNLNFVNHLVITKKICNWQCE
jgi:Na+-transporting NADH:ubiquinone oxidoreductase subunit NqrF